MAGAAHAIRGSLVTRFRELSDEFTHTREARQEVKDNGGIARQSAQVTHEREVAADMYEVVKAFQRHVGERQTPG